LNPLIQFYSNNATDLLHLAPTRLRRVAPQITVTSLHPAYSIDIINIHDVYGVQSATVRGLRVLAGYGSEQYRTRSSRGFEPIQEEMPPVSDPFVARAQSRWHAGTPPSDRGSQVSTRQQHALIFPPA